VNQCPPSPSQTALEWHGSDVNDQAMVHEIYCWHLGEDRIAFWHDLDSGYVGRQPL
jgi:hypothetical protein